MLGQETSGDLVFSGWKVKYFLWNSILLLDAVFLGGAFVFSVEPVMAGPYRVTR